MIALAKGLIAAGIQAGDRVALMSKTRYEWTLIDYAIWAAGAVTVPIYETSSTEQVAWILSDSGAVACFVETPAPRRHGRRRPATTLPGAARGLGHRRRRGWTTLVADGAGDAGQRGRGAPAPRSARRRRRHDHLHQRHDRPAEGLRADPPQHATPTSPTRSRACANLFNEGSSTLLFLPLAHSFARLIQIGVVAGPGAAWATAPTSRTWSPTWARSSRRSCWPCPGCSRRSTTAPSSARTPTARARSSTGPTGSRSPTARRWTRRRGPGFAAAGCSTGSSTGSSTASCGPRSAAGATAAISGGAPLGARLAHFFRGIGVTDLRGLRPDRDLPGGRGQPAGRAIRIGTVGRPLPGVTIRIADDGEILIKGDLVFRGYWNNAAATAEAIDADGWFHTGDLGALDDDGYLRITGRKKEIIVTAGGKNVAPAVLEDRVRAHPLVSQCMVVGDGKPFIAALVTIDEEAWPKWLAEHGLPAECDRRRSARRCGAAGRRSRRRSTTPTRRSRRPRRSATFRILPGDWTEETGELTPSLKVKRNVVMKEYADEIAAIYG